MFIIVCFLLAQSSEKTSFEKKKKKGDCISNYRYIYREASASRTNITYSYTDKTKIKLK